MSDVKKKNGQTTLGDVVEAIEKLGDRLDTRIDKLEGRIDKLDRGVNSRLDGVLKLLGGYHRDHERRIVALEKTVADLKKAG